MDQQPTDSADMKCPECGGTMIDGTCTVCGATSAPAVDSGKSEEYLAKCLARAKKRIEKALRPHKKREKDYDRRYRAYKGVIDRDKDRWNHQTHPPYILQVIETLDAVLVDDSTVTKVFPAQPDSADAAEALEKILRQQQEKANYDEEKAKFTKYSLIYGIGVAKVHWKETRQAVTRWYWDNGPDAPPVERTEIEVLFDQPRFDTIDPKDFFWDPSATNLDNAEYVCFRYYADKDWVKAMGEPGPDGEPPRWMNADKLLESAPRSGDGMDRAGSAVIPGQTDIDHSNEYEIIEVWTNDSYVVVGNQMVLLQDDPNPFWHGEKPFVTASTLTDLGRVEGQSEVEILIELQNIIWDMENQTWDNAELANNAIVMMSSDVEDPDSYEFFPGARWIVDRNDEVGMWTPNTAILGASQGIIDGVKNTLQNIAAATQFLSGADTDGVDPKTATAVKAASNMAQRRVLRKKALLNYAYKRTGRLWIALNQQFMTEPMILRVDGPHGMDFKKVTPYEIQGQFDYYVESMSESLDREQKREEAILLFDTVAAQCGGVPGMAQAGLNSKAFVEKLLASFDIQNPEAFMTPPPAPLPQLPQQGLQQLPPQYGAQQGQLPPPPPQPPQ